MSVYSKKFFRKLSGNGQAKTKFKMLKAGGLFFLLRIFPRVIGYYFRQKILRQKRVLKKINGSYIMELDIGERGIDKALYMFRTREELETEVVKNTVKEGMRVLDLGANIGYYTLLLAELVGSEGKIYAVEPLPSNFERLKKHIALNKLQSRVEIENVAISDRTGEMEFFIGEKHNLGSLEKLNTEWQTKEKIKTKTYSFADFFSSKPNIDFVRMDVERGELAIFQNMIEEFPKRGLKYPKRIMFEVHPVGDIDPDPTFTPLLNKLSEIGYRAEYAVASANPTSIEKYKAVGYNPEKVSFRGHALYKDIKKEHLIDIAARRKKITRAILLTIDE